MTGQAKSVKITFSLTPCSPGPQSSTSMHSHDCRGDSASGTVPEYAATAVVVALGAPLNLPLLPRRKDPLSPAGTWSTSSN